MTHTLVANADETIPAGSCVTEGPYAVPAGASMTYQIFDNAADDMDVGFTQSADGCDLANFGAAVYSSAYWDGTISRTVDNVPADTYLFVMNCYNSDGAPCIPTLDFWTYDH